MKNIPMYFNFWNFEQTYKKYYKYDVHIIYTQWNHMYGLRLKKIWSSDMHTSCINSMLHQRILVSDIISTYIILRCREICWSMFRMIQMKNKALQHVSNIFWEIFLSAHNRHRKMFFVLDVAQKSINIFQLLFKAENEEKKNIFLNPKQEISVTMIKLWKKQILDLYKHWFHNISVDGKFCRIFFNQILLFFLNLYGFSIFLINSW